ncbi:hypothetical protein CHLRE_10g454500v5 [Chlamydomonas reinhardtii]|uniref:Uncharacterized protein n=1 Tax=Chlamydomonas reinhardtii TaxID=3055 RepID=A0A2K3DBF0_CHLRE|nr:uncharacterized protein CHLRE_10g454500v5 [Chlamydomonas reinhardtii]PNW77857.1 hypothetical protein CHLRE_10g454500v5 [Chlamydomonas reinhardtii]
MLKPPLRCSLLSVLRCGGRFAHSTSGSVSVMYGMPSAVSCRISSSSLASRPAARILLGPGTWAAYRMAPV